MMNFNLWLQKYYSPFYNVSFLNLHHIFQEQNTSEVWEGFESDKSLEPHNYYQMQQLCELSY